MIGFRIQKCVRKVDAKMAAAYRELPVAIDGMVIEPGDLIVGAEDVVLCVPNDAVQTTHVRLD